MDYLTRRSPEQVLKRFWAKVDLLGPISEHRPDLGNCWIWKAGTVGSGEYGQFYASRENRVVRAHCFAYELLVGPIPEGLVLDHLCRVPRCVNPDHLEPVTRKENCRRGNRGELMTHCPNGHEYTPENTGITHRGARCCIACLERKGRSFTAAQGRRCV